MKVFHPNRWQGFVNQVARILHLGFAPLRKITHNAYMTVTAAIVEARLRSTRLPAKTLLSLPTGRNVIQEVLYRASKIKGVDVVVAALADDAGTDLLLPWVKYSQEFAHDSHATPIGIFRGPEHDVLRRDLLAAKSVGAETVMRLTSDCPLLDPNICGQVLEAYRSGFVDYCTNAFPRTWPRGYDCEVFSMDVLKEADKYGDDQYPDNRQGVDVWMQASPNVRRLNIEAPGKMPMDSRGHIQWSLDTINDYEVICAELNRRLDAGGDALCE